MTEDEIHDFGIEVVAKQMQKDGYEIQSMNSKPDVNPQVVAKKSNQLAFVAVRTACYPEKGILDRAVHIQMIEHAEKFDAIPYFGSVGIANAEGKSNEEMSTPIKGAGFHVAYDGLLIITRSEEQKGDSPD